MTTPLSLAVRQARLTVVRDHIAALWLYDGTLPSSPDAATTDTKLATLTLATPSGAIGATGAVATLTATVPIIATVAVTGTVAWARFVDDTGVAVMDCLVSAVDGSTPVVLSDTNIFTGAEVQLLSCVITEA
jgi:hypothetical protein